MRAESLRAPAPPTTTLGGYLFKGILRWGFAVGNSGFLSLSRQLGLPRLGEKGFSLLSQGYGGGPAFVRCLWGKTAVPVFMGGGSKTFSPSPGEPRRRPDAGFTSLLPYCAGYLSLAPRAMDPSSMNSESWSEQSLQCVLTEIKRVVSHCRMTFSQPSAYYSRATAMCSADLLS